MEVGVHRAVSRGVSCLLCAGVAFVNQANVVPGWDAVAGRLHPLGVAGCVAFVAAAVLAVSVRVAAGVAVLGAGLCVPVDLYLLDPGLFGGGGGVPGADAYVVGEWAALGLVTMAVAAFAFVRPARGAR